MEKDIKSLKIFQVTHKDSSYLLNCHWVDHLSVGEYRNNRASRTDVLDNINNLNPFYNELTAIYWVWKNLKYDYLGFYHYRRVLNYSYDNTWSGDYGFSINNSEKVKSYFSSEMQLNNLRKLLEVSPVVIPRLTSSKKTTEAHYKEHHGSESWECFLSILSKKYGGHNAAQLFSSTNLQTSFNIFVMRRDIFQSYCEELFSVIDEVFSEVGVIEHPYNKRYPGFLAERFLHFWLLMRSVSYLEVPVIMFED